ncbi:MAG: TrbC/VirB2 family protein [Vicinamibacteraceae bacterium]
MIPCTRHSPDRHTFAERRRLEEAYERYVDQRVDAHLVGLHPDVANRLVRTKSKELRRTFTIAPTWALASLPSMALIAARRDIARRLPLRAFEAFCRQHRPAAARHRRLLPFVAIAIISAALIGSFPADALAQAPWERAAANLEQTFTGPLARSLALVAIVIGGLFFMFGEGGATRQISGIVFGGGLALFAGQFLTWLF